MRARSLAFAVTLVGALTAVEQARGQSAPAGPSDEELRRESQNPVSSLISLPFQNNTNFPIGPYGRVQDVMDIQPVVPSNFGSVNLITRWIAPVIYQPNIASPTGSASGLGDMNPTFFLSPAAANKLIWGFGPAFLFPTATNATLGQGKWGAGPSLVLLMQPEHWTIGVLMNNIWSFAGPQSRPPINQFLLQYFVNYNMSGGWYVGSQPIITANWRAPANNVWLMPAGFAVGRITRLGRQPINAQAGLYYSAIHPQDLPYGKWQLRLQLAFLFPKAK